MRGKDSKGKWREPFDPLMATSPMNNPGDYTEANAWQYFWTPAQYDAEGMIEMLGGKEKFTGHLDSFFTIKALNPNKHLGQEAMIGQYAHGNEPSHHIAWLYAFSNTPEKGRELITQICNQFYQDTPDGMIGNDDCGQMSAWYIFSALGFYPVNPSNGTLVLGHPQVKKARVVLNDGKILTIDRKKVGKIELNKSILWNGEYLTGPDIEYKRIVVGGHLQFEH
jgi:predicted alpha-1,2-mannosidase